MSNQTKPDSPESCTEWKLQLANDINNVHGNTNKAITDHLWSLGYRKVPTDSAAPGGDVERREIIEKLSILRRRYLELYDANQHTGPQGKRIMEDFKTEAGRLCFDFFPYIAALSAPKQVGVTDGWVSVNDRLPEEELLVAVYTPDKGDGAGVNFDFRYEGGWRDHDNSFEHFMAVGGSGAAGPDCICIGPSEQAPYTHWRDIGTPFSSQQPAPQPVEGMRVPDPAPAYPDARTDPFNALMSRPQPVEADDLGLGGCYWRERAEFWRAQAVSLGWREKRDADNGEQLMETRGREPSPNWCSTCGKLWNDPRAVFCSDGIHNRPFATPPEQPAIDLAALTEVFKQAQSAEFSRLEPITRPDSPGRMQANMDAATTVALRAVLAIIDGAKGEQPNGSGRGGAMDL